MDNDKKISNVGGLPVALILFTVALILLIDIPIWFFGFAPLQRALNQDLVIKFVPVQHRVIVTPTLAPTATPSAALIPATRSALPVTQSRVVAPVK